MAKSSNSLKLPYPTEGVIRSVQLNDTVAPENSDQLGINVHYDRIGARTTRNGISTYAPSLGGKILTLGSLFQNSSSVKWLLAQVANVISAWNGSSWSAVRTMTSTVNKARYSQFLNLVYTVNGNAAIGGDLPQTFNGSSYGNTNVSNLPAGDFVQAGYEGRVWIADANLDRLYFSDIVTAQGVITAPIVLNLTGVSGTFVDNETITGGTSGATAQISTIDGTSLVLTNVVGTFLVGENVTGTTSGATGVIGTITTQYIEKISPQDGESFTGIHRHPQALLLFKQNHIFRVYGASSVDAYPAYNVGTFSNESIVEAKDGLYFHHPSGFYKFNYDGQPTEISRRIKDFVRAIPLSAAANVTGSWDGIDNIEWAIGSVTVEGVAYGNCIVRYSISTQVWTIYDKLGSSQVSAQITYNNGNVIAMIAGLSDGSVVQLESGTTDLGEPIFFEIITRWMSLTQQWSALKNLSGFAAYSANGAGSKLQYQVDNDVPDKWRDILEFSSDYMTLAPNDSTDDFTRIRFRISGQTIGTPIVFDGIEILTLTDLGFSQN